jgi:hypothetical protein
MRIDGNALGIELEIAKNQVEDLRRERQNVDQKLSEQLDDLESISNEVRNSIRNASTHIEQLASWPKDAPEASKPYESITLHELVIQKNKLLKEYSDEVEIIRDGIVEIRHEMLRWVGTVTEQYCLAANQERGSPLTGREYEWLEVCRRWFNSEYKSNQDQILQNGRAQGLAISQFHGALDNLKRSVATFNREIRNSLSEGKMFARIEEVDVQITTDIDKQNYWAAVERLKFEYESWHPISNNSMPPRDFVEAAKAVATILSDERGLVAKPADLIQIRVSAKVNGREVSAKEEKELQGLSSNGLSYVVLSIVMVGFVNRIRRGSQVMIPFAVDELKDLDYPNATTLLEFLAQNHINLIAAFPDVDQELVPHFAHNYQVMDDRHLASIVLELEEGDEVMEDSYV